MNIINALPGILPSARPYTMGQWPQKPMKMRNGRTVKWGLSSRQTGDKMELSWENITYAQAELLCAVWDANYGILGKLTLPTEALAGTSGGLNDLLATPFPDVVWRFSAAPQVTPAKARRCTVRMFIETRFAPLLPFVFSDLLGPGPLGPDPNFAGRQSDPANLDRSPAWPLSGAVVPGSALVAPDVECPDGCQSELRLMRGNDLIVTNKTPYYVLGTNDVSNGQINIGWQYRCNCPNQPAEGWKDARLRGGPGLAYPNPPVEDPWLRPDREIQRYWKFIVRRFGFIGPIEGWYNADTDITIVTTGDEFDSFPVGGGPPRRGINGNIFVNGVYLSGGTFYIDSPWAWVAKIRYRDNNGPWIEGESFENILLSAESILEAEQ